MLSKFRYWDGETQTMHRVDNLNFVYDESSNVEKVSVAYDHSSKISTLLLNDTNDELMQSTGIFDIQGIEIFEGDIVKDNYGEIMLVKFGEFYHEELHSDVAKFVGFNLLLSRGYFTFEEYDYEIVGHKFMKQYEGKFE